MPQYLGKRIAVLGIAIAVVNGLATIFYWYSSIWWFDMPMHFAGGLFIGLLAYSILASLEIPFIQRLRERSSPVIAIIIVVAIIGVGWEIFEYALQYFSGAQFANPLDSVSDFFFDLVGAAAAGLYLLRKLASIRATRVEPDAI